MSVINTNIPALIAANNLARVNQGLQKSLQRLATGFRINSGADDPAGLIASEHLRSDLASTDAAIANAQRAKNVVATAEGGLAEVSNLLISLNGLVTQSANTGGLSPDEQRANQLQVDSILSTINRISNATTFSSTKLLNGSLDYRTSGLATTSAFSSFSIHSAGNFSNTAAIQVKVLASAQKAELDFLGSSTGLSGPATISIAGATGSVQLSFGSATKSSAIVAGINALADSVGISAVLSSDSKSVRILSQAYGSRQFVSVTSSNSTAFTALNTSGSAVSAAHGRDAQLTIDGTPVQTDGLNAHIANGFLDADFTLNPAFNTNGATKLFGITGGGAQFAISPNIDSGGILSLGIPSVHTSSIGQTTYGGNQYSLADLGTGHSAALFGGNPTLASQIVNQAVRDVATLRGRLGAIETNEIDSTINYLSITRENLASAESQIRDTDFASETANLTRYQILAQAATSALSLASKSPQNILKLLG